MYAADRFQGCLVEVYQDNCKAGFALKRRHCTLQVQRALLLLDLRGNGALGAGVPSSISTVEHVLAQRWSCHFSDHPEDYGDIDGLVYHNSHNEQNAYAFYERCSGEFEPASDNALSEATRRREYSFAAWDANLDIDFGITKDP